MNVLPDTFVTLDIETQRWSDEVEGGWQNMEGFGLSCAVTHTKHEGYRHYFEKDVDTLITYLHNADLVVGFNLKSFDYKVLSAYTDRKFTDIPTFDILEEIYQTLGHRVKLAMLALANFDEVRESNLKKSVDWYKQKNMTKVKDYCQQDVLITRRIFLKALEDKQLFWHWHNNPKRVECLKTDYWAEKACSLMENLQPNVRELNLGVVVELALKMPDESGDLEMTHDQERVVVGLIESLHTTCETLKSIGSPIEVLDIKSYLKKGLRRIS